jgi:peptide chain release factor 2
MDQTAARIAEIESLMASPSFWEDKQKAQLLIRELQELKDKAEGKGSYDSGSAVMTIFAGAGGDDAEDFARMLFEMYQKYAAEKGWSLSTIHQNENDRGGFRNITVELNGKSAYGTLKRESGVHRLVRLSPFNAKQLRHTSFAMVEVIPKFEKATDEEIPDSELTVEFARSSGPGGQNVNKRETAVHTPTNLAAHADSERSQEANRKKALAVLKGKLYKMREEEREAKEKGMYISKTTQAEWGSQIRSYVLHPYKLVKDHRTGAEVRDAEAVLNGAIDEFIDAEKNLS